MARASMLQLVHQVEDYARVERAAARAHRQSVRGGEAHRARDAGAAGDRAHAGAVAQMQRRRPCRAPPPRRSPAAPARCTRRTARGSRSAARPASVIASGSANACATGGCVRWNAVSKHATCGNCGAAGEQRADRREVVRLVQRRQRHEFLERREHVRVDAHGQRVRRDRHARPDVRRRPGGTPRGARAGTRSGARARPHAPEFRRRPTSSR